MFDKYINKINVVKKLGNVNDYLFWLEREILECLYDFKDDILYFEFVISILLFFIIRKFDILII